MIIEIELDGGGTRLLNMSWMKYTEPRGDGGTIIHMTANKSEECTIGTPETVESLWAKLGLKPKTSNRRVKKEV